MYKPKKYLVENKEKLKEFIDEHPFALFVTEKEGLCATHIPVLSQPIENDDFILFSHIAKHNEQLAHLSDGAEALIVFQGAHGYVSSSWYDHPNISTWDYSAVHVNAKIRLQDQAQLRASLDMLVHRFEKDQENPVYMDDLPDDIIDSHLPRIVGFYLEPTKIQGIAKLHQGYSQENIQSIISHLKERKADMDRILIGNLKNEHKSNN